MSVKNFEDLEVWKRSCQIAVDIYTSLHSSKDYGLKDQMQRSAVSIASNIAEGAERASTPEYIRFLRIAKASCGELRTQLYISKKNKNPNKTGATTKRNKPNSRIQRNIQNAPRTNHLPPTHNQLNPITLATLSFKLSPLSLCIATYP